MSEQVMTMAPGSRTLLYLRVSSGKQAERDISKPDQRKQLRAFCKHSAAIIVGEYKDAKSARDDKRRSFQAMIDDIEQGVVHCDVIVVHSYSRFFRDEVHSELYMRALAKRGVRVVSLSQPVEDSPAGQMFRRFLALFDEFQSIEISKHVTRSLHENATQGFFNGGVAPFGYQSVEVERRGDTPKKKLKICESEAAVVRLIFSLYVHGDESSGPMGVNKIVGWLNDRGYSTRKGKKWDVNTIHRRLTDPANMGTRIINSKLNGAVEIPVSVPPIIDEEKFLRVQETLASKNPKKMPPRMVTGDVLLTGLVKCPHCAGGMTTSTGKSGRFRYYACSTKMRKGISQCVGRRVPMGKMDKLILKALRKDLLTTQKVWGILETVRKRQGVSEKLKQDRLAAREDDILDARQKVDRLYEMVEGGLTDLHDEDFKERFSASKEALRKARQERDQVASELSPSNVLDSEKVRKFVGDFSSALNQGSILRQRSYLRSIVDCIEVGESSIRINCQISSIEKAVLSEQINPSSVPTFVRQWRRRSPSN